MKISSTAPSVNCSGKLNENLRLVWHGKCNVLSVCAWQRNEMPTIVVEAVIPVRNTATHACTLHIIRGKEQKRPKYIYVLQCAKCTSFRRETSMSLVSGERIFTREVVTKADEAAQYIIYHVICNTLHSSLSVPSARWKRNGRISGTFNQTRKRNTHTLTTYPGYLRSVHKNLLSPLRYSVHWTFFLFEQHEHHVPLCITLTYLLCAYVNLNANAVQ